MVCSSTKEHRNFKVSLSGRSFRFLRRLQLARACIRIGCITFICFNQRYMCAFRNFRQFFANARRALAFSLAARRRLTSSLRDGAIEKARFFECERRIRERLGRKASDQLEAREAGQTNHAKAQADNIQSARDRQEIQRQRRRYLCVRCCCSVLTDDMKC